ncbi:MAG TPA: hypothetical protein VNR60_09535 [Croceibacterium sp.]|nr:hypothetical protein [Croceibacterium sp.]
MNLATVLSIVMLAALALVAGAVLLWRRGQRGKAGLMLVLAAIMVANVLIWTIPDSGGVAPIDRMEQGPG